jgi:3-oxoacyl-(acyl-carrier-protein) reductase
MSIGLEKATAEDFELPSFALHGKKALITGGSRGIGKATALTLANLGADVALTYYTGCKFAEDVRGQIRDMGRQARCYAHDIGEPDSFDELRAQVLNELGPIDILVNNAGITRDRSFKKMTSEMWNDVLAVNLTGAFHMTKAFIDEMADRGWGRVVNISSIVGEVGNFGQANYAAAKAGLIGLTKTLAREYAKRGVTVNAVAPGFTRTRMLQSVPDKALQSVIDLTPVGRLCEPAEIAAGVAFLASPAASYITGHVLSINGGMAM